MSQKERKWFKPLFEFDDREQPKKLKKDVSKKPTSLDKRFNSEEHKSVNKSYIDHKNCLKNFHPVIAEDLAVHNKKVQEVEDWIKTVCKTNSSDMLLLTGPVGCGKTVTIKTVASKYHIKVSEWITPLDIDMPTEYGDYEFKEKQSLKFLNFIINAANFTSLLDNNSNKLVLVEDFPNALSRNPSEFADVLYQYKQRAKSPIVFICSETHTDNKNTAVNIFTPNLKEQFHIHHITFNTVSATGLRSALKRVSEIISKKYTSMYDIPSSDLIDCVVNSSGGDVRSAVLNLHFACLKGSKQKLETSIIEKENKSKVIKTSKKKKASSKFLSLGKDETVSILHGVGRVLNPKVLENGSFTHSPQDIIEQFLSQPASFVNFLEENYLSHFSCLNYVDKAASALSDADYMLGEWREKMCQEYGLYIAIAGLMIANKEPVSAWNPVRGPKNMRIQNVTSQDVPLLEQNHIYSGKVLVSDYKTYCKIIGNSNKLSNTNCSSDMKL